MSSTRVVGPLGFGFGSTGLAPGAATGTVWTTNPPYRGGTVQFTAVPIDVPGADGGRLAVRDPTIQAVTSSGGVSSTDFTLHVIVANVGQNTVHNASMYITFIEP
jgi:hypothetical protein